MNNTRLRGGFSSFLFPVYRQLSLYSPARTITPGGYTEKTMFCLFQDKMSMHHFRPEMSAFVSNLARLAPNGTNLGLFKISFLFILARCAKMNRKLILKSPRFVPFGTNLTLFETKSDIPANIIMTFTFLKFLNNSWSLFLNNL